MNVTDAPSPTTRVADEAETDPLGVVHRFVRELIACYRRVQASPAAAGLEPEALLARLTSLRLAESVIRLARPAARPLQLAVIGPTQAGKSTIVNLLVGRRAAQVSPLAGFTVHPQGFWVSPIDADETWAEGLFPGWRRCAPDQLARDELDAFALGRVDPPFALSSEPSEGAAPELPSCVVWDTPDFDSLSARDYQDGVLESEGLADAYLLVLSTEKYSDLSVWKMLRLLEPLGRPLVICLNKLSPEFAEEVTRSLRERLAEFARGWGDVPIVTIGYHPHLGDAAADAACELEQAGAAALRQAVIERLKAARRPPDAGVRALVRAHWESWSAPVRAEHAAVDEWNRQIETGLKGFVQRYRRDYLDHPHRYDAFRRAALELLHLLEIPRIGGWITKARQVTTWPVRQLWAAGRAWHASRRDAGAGRHRLGAEAAVLFDALENLLRTLQRDLERRRGSTSPGLAVWRAIQRRLMADEARLRERFSSALEEHHAAVTLEVQAAANSLYEQLQQQPVRLAALRTARASIDAGALLLALKTGGLTPIDALWAPATFALSSLLMETFAGAQMAAASRSLKKRQLETVQKTLVQQVLTPELRRLADRRDDEGLLGITVEQFAAAEQALKTWEQQDHG